MHYANLKQLAFCVIFFFSLFACGENKSTSPDPAEQPKTVETSEPASLPFQYKVTGDGPLTLVFVHGWCINQSYWSKQVAAFSEKYKVVTLDLPGFGTSSVSDHDWTIEQYGADVSALIQHLDLKNVVLIGHSMGGDIILETALQNDQVLALVGVDNFKFVGLEMDRQTQDEVADFIALLEANFSELAPAYAESSLFHASTDSTVRARVLHDFANTDSIAGIGSFKALFAYVGKEAEKLKQLQQPMFLLNSDAVETDTASLNNLEIDYQMIIVGTTGHYPMLEEPEAFNQKLAATLQKIEQGL